MDWTASVLSQLQQTHINLGFDSGAERTAFPCLKAGEQRYSGSCLKRDISAWFNDEIGARGD